MARESKIAARRWNWRLTAAIAVLALAGVTTAMAALKVRRFVTTDPQFELSREEIPSGGVVIDEKLHEKAIAKVRQEVESLGLAFLGVHPSHLLGAEGNQEYFLHARKKSLE